MLPASALPVIVGVVSLVVVDVVVIDGALGVVVSIAVSYTHLTLPTKA